MGRLGEVPKVTYLGFKSGILVQGTRVLTFHSLLLRITKSHRVSPSTFSSVFILLPLPFWAGVIVTRILQQLPNLSHCLQSHLSSVHSLSCTRMIALKCNLILSTVLLKILVWLLVAWWCLDPQDTHSWPACVIKPLLSHLQPRGSQTLPCTTVTPRA